MLRRAKIRTKLIVVSAVPIVALLVVAAFAVSTFSQVRVQGPNYERIVNSKDVVADVLPPPEYIIEAYLTVLQVVEPQNDATREEKIAQLARLEKEYRERHAYWNRVLDVPEIRETLLKRSYEPADQFFKIVNAELIPLVRNSGNKKVIQAEDLARGRLQALYNEHRKSIDLVVQQASAQQRLVEADTSRLINRQLIILGFIFAGLIGTSVLVGIAVVRSIVRPINRLRQVASEDLPRVIAQVKDSGFDQGQAPTLEPVKLDTQDELAEAATAFNGVVEAAVNLAGEQARLRRNTADTFVNLGRRNQNLVTRQLRFIDQLEKSETDPALLKSLFRLDHLATRMRRNAESLLVLAGVEPPRKWKKPVSLVDVIRGSLAEVEGYERVQLGMIEPAQIPGFGVADMSHMIAEITENSLRFSPPDSAVTITGTYRQDAYLISVADQGMGMAPNDIQAANLRLGGASGFDEAPTAHLGLFVVSRLAHRYNIKVELESDGGDGLTAQMEIPLAMLEEAASGTRATSATLDASAAAAGRGRHSAPVPGQPSAVAAPPRPRADSVLPPARAESEPAVGHRASSDDVNWFSPPPRGRSRSNPDQFAPNGVVESANGVSAAAPSMPQRVQQQPPITQRPVAPPPVAMPRAVAPTMAPPPVSPPPMHPRVGQPPPPVAPPATPSWAAPAPATPARSTTSGPAQPSSGTGPFEGLGLPGVPRTPGAEEPAQFTKAGFKKRASKTPLFAPMTPPGLTDEPRYDRPADDVRTRYDNFSAGKQRAVTEAPPEATDRNSEVRPGGETAGDGYFEN
jgi:signal transduction histidine kinase